MYRYIGTNSREKMSEIATLPYLAPFQSGSSSPLLLLYLQSGLLSGRFWYSAVGCATGVKYSDVYAIGDSREGGGLGKEKYLGA